jgi:hypothetical protein
MADFEIRPKSVTLSGNQAQAFEAVRNGQPIAGVTWSVRPTAGSGTIDPVTGLYAAPRFVLLGRKVYVQATFRGVRLPAPGDGGCQGGDSPGEAAEEASDAGEAPEEPAGAQGPQAHGVALDGPPEHAHAADGQADDAAAEGSQQDAPPDGPLENTGGVAGGRPFPQAAVATIELTSLQWWTAILGAYWIASFMGLLFLLLYLWNGLCPTCRLKVSPPVVTLNNSQAQVFTVNGEANWSGGVQANGLYTPPSDLKADQRVTITATSSSDAKKSASADVFLSTDLSLYIHPQDSEVQSRCDEGKSGCRAVVIASVTPTPGVEPSSGVVEWLQPSLGRIEPVNGFMASFWADKVEVERPTPILLLAHMKGRMSRVAGAWITILPRPTRWRPFGLHSDDCASEMIGILTLIAIMGALGGIVHGISSFATFVGNRELKPSWLWWYFLKPFLGASVSLVVYLVFRAGFGGNDYSLGSADCVKVAALAGLIGLFAEPATIKLRDIFDTLFTTRDDKRKDAAGAATLKLESLDPATVTAGQAQPLSLRILGTGFTAGSQVKIGDGAPRVPAHMTPTQLDLSLQPADVKTAHDLPVVVVNDGQRSNTLVLKVVSADASPAASGAAPPTPQPGKGG